MLDAVQFHWVEDAEAVVPTFAVLVVIRVVGAFCRLVAFGRELRTEYEAQIAARAVVKFTGMSKSMSPQFAILVVVMGALME